MWVSDAMNFPCRTKSCRLLRCPTWSKRFRWVLVWGGRNMAVKISVCKTVINLFTIWSHFYVCYICKNVCTICEIKQKRENNGSLNVDAIHNSFCIPEDAGLLDHTNNSGNTSQSWLCFVSMTRSLNICLSILVWRMSQFRTKEIAMHFLL